MKKIINPFIFLFSLLSLNLVAQIEVITCDTLGVSIASVPQFSPNNQVSRIPYAGGWVFGTNYDPFNQLVGNAQGFENSSTQQIVGVLAFYAAKSKNTNNPTETFVNFRIHNMVNGGAYDVSAGNLTPVIGPATPTLAFGTMQFEEVDTTLGTYNFVALNQPAIVNGNFAIAVEYEAMKLAGDTIGFLSDNTGNGLSMKYTFHQVRQAEDLFWVTTQTLFQGALDVNIGLFPVMNCDTTIVEDPTSLDALENYTAVNGLKAVIFPNPISYNANALIEISNADSYSIEIFDLQGRKINTIALGFKSTGRHSVEIETASLASGSYIFSLLSSSGQRYSKMFIKK